MTDGPLALSPFLVGATIATIKLAGSSKINNKHSERPKDCIFGCSIERPMNFQGFFPSAGRPPLLPLHFASSI